MSQGSKDKYTGKQKRQAEHIAEGYEDKGVPQDEAEARAWATVNKLHGGGKKSGSGRKPDPRTPEQRSAAAKKAAATRKRNAAAKKAG